MTQLYSDIIYISLFHSGTIQPFLHCLVLHSPLLHDWDYVLTCLFSWLELCIRSVYWDYVPVSFLGIMYPLCSEWDYVLASSFIGTLSLRLCNSLWLYYWDYVLLLCYPNHYYLTSSSDWRMTPNSSSFLSFLTQVYSASQLFLVFSLLVTPISDYYSYSLNLLVPKFGMLT